MREDTPTGPGVTVRGYRIERLIGTGGAAAVYEARRLGPGGPGERVACKVMHAKRRDEPRDREQVRQEAVLGLRVTAGHRNLVEILDFFDDPEAQHCIVMELVDGASVAELRGPDRRLPFLVARRVAVEVLEALVYLHGRGVLHRDLSPRNILVTAGGVVKVADLGIARVMEQGLVHTETIRGTPMYVAREAIELLPLDARVDLFSLGAVLYDLVTGQPPCGDQSRVAKMFARTAAGQFAPLPPDTPADLAELITGLLPPDRNARRPQTAAEALALLRRHGQPLPSEAELAGMVAPALERRDRELERPANMLAPGHVLAPRDAQDTAERAIIGAADAVPHLVADPLPAGVAGRGIYVVADAESSGVDDPAADAEPDRVADPLPGGEAACLLDAVVARVADAAPPREADREADAAPHLVADPLPAGMAGRVIYVVADAESSGVDDPGRASGRPGDARRSVAGRLAIVMCLLVPAVLLDDGFRGEQAAVTPVLPAEIPALVVVPTPAPPVEPVVVTPVPVLESPRHATEPLDGSRHERTAVQRRDRPARPSAPRWRSAPHVSEPPPWGQ